MAGIPAAVPSARTTTASLSTSPNSNKSSAEKWSGGVHLVLNCNLDAAWSLQSDFIGLPKWVPTISISRLVEGEPNAIGCMRYCKGTGTTWVHERLLELDHAAHYMSYRMEDNHFVFPEGFKGYVAKVKLGKAGEGLTWVSWTYEVDPVVSETQKKVTEFMIEFYSGNLKFLEMGANKLVAENSEAAGKPTSVETSGSTAPAQAPLEQAA